METENLELTIEVYATEDLGNGFLVWETESITLMQVSDPFPLTKSELQILIDSLNGGDMNPAAADSWHTLTLERQYTNNGYSEPQYDWYSLKHMKAIGNNNEF